jgi:hypothetical protein
VAVQIQGTVEAPSNRSVWLDGDLPDRWITFEDIDNLRVTGGGTINGNGQEWWINSCKVNKSMVPSLYLPSKVQTVHFFDWKWNLTL